MQAAVTIRERGCNHVHVHMNEAVTIFERGCNLRRTLLGRGLGAGGGLGDVWARGRHRMDRGGFGAGG